MDQENIPNILDNGFFDPSKPRCEDVYEFKEIIGDGSFSDVVSAEHNVTKKVVAIKIIDKKKLETEKQKARIRNEVRIVSKLPNHPNIVKFEEIYESDTDICLVMELCGGGELFNRICEEGCFSEKEASQIMKQIASAISFLHSLGVVHRDIKPENILFVSKEKGSDVKLCDFGFAKKLDIVLNGRASLKASSSGTTAYCAPERLAQSSESKAVDMWSLGCILYFMLIGRPPFYSLKEDEEENEDEIYDAVENSLERGPSFPPSRELSTSGKDLIKGLLQHDPNRRYTAEEVLQHPWVKGNSFSPEASPSVSKTTSSEGKKFLKESINKVIDLVEEEMFS